MQGFFQVFLKLTQTGSQIRSTKNFETISRFFISFSLFLYRGLVPHCISILKSCHQLTERLVGMTMSNSDKIHTQEMLTDIVLVAKRINPRVDEVVQSMYPPLDPRLLEARYC